MAMTQAHIKRLKKRVGEMELRLVHGINGTAEARTSKRRKIGCWIEESPLDEALL
jgi:hypothetical protein